MSDISEIGIEIEKHLSKIGEDVQKFFKKVVPMENTTSAFSPESDILESPEQVKILIDLPGLSKKEIGIRLKDYVLTISGERDEFPGEAETYKRKERRQGAFSRAFSVPQSIRSSEIKANFKNGVLIITLPKSEDKKNEAIQID